MSDMVNHPEHYNQGGIECIDAIKAATVGKTGIEAFCVGNAIKYLWRFEEKNGLEDVKKAKCYIERLIAELDNSEDTQHYDCVLDVTQDNDGDDMEHHSCFNCLYDALDSEDEPCCKCKNIAVYGSEEYRKRSCFFESKKK